MTIVVAALLILPATYAGAELELDESGWYAWGRDYHNSRTADCEFGPSIGLKWRDSLEYVRPEFSRVYAQDGKVFVVREWGDDDTIGSLIYCYNAETGENQWTYRKDGAVTADTFAMSVLGHGYIWWGIDVCHPHGGRIDAETGDGWSMEAWGGPGIMQRYANIHSTGIYAIGSDVSDSSGRKLKAIDVVNTPLAHPVEDGRVGGAFEFPGRRGGNDFLNLGNILNPEDKDFTIMFWFKHNPNPENNDASLFSKGKGWPGTLYKGILTSGGYALFKFWPAEGGSIEVGEGEFPTDKDVWYHFAFTYNHNQLKLYKNGELLENAVVDYTGDIGSNDADFYIGGARERESFDGQIDEFVVYERALSETEILDLYQIMTAPEPQEITPDESTQLLFHFNNDPAHEENAEFIYDYSGNNNHAVYDGHLCQKVRWSTGWGKVTGITRSWGQPAIHENTIYISLGKLFAYDINSNPEKPIPLWEKGEFPSYANPGDIMYSDEVTYNDGVVYAFGREKTGPEWEDLGRAYLYGYDISTEDKDEVCCIEAEEDIAPLQYSGAKPRLEAIISNNVAYISTIYRIRALQIPSGGEIWSYERNCITLGTRPAQVGDIILSDDILYAIGEDNQVIVGLDTQNQGNLVWIFDPRLSDPQIEHHFTGLAIADNMLFASTYEGMLYAIEDPGYQSPVILEDDQEFISGQVGREYEEIELHVEYGAHPFQWSVSAGEFPPGLALQNDEHNIYGIISGTPTLAGDYTFTVRVTDSQTNYDEKTYSMKIYTEAISIYTIEDLNNVRNNPALSYALQNDLDFTGTIYQEGQGFEPIADFGGLFDGQGHTISNLYINRPDGDSVGLFANLKPGGTIQNVNLAEVDVNGYMHIGGLVGKDEGGTITNCHAAGILGGNTRCGGLVGYSYGGLVSGCSAHIDIACTGAQIGGLIGNINNGAVVENSYATGNISYSWDYPGGLVGFVQHEDSIIRNSYATGNIISGHNYAGGLVGWLGGTILNCYAEGDVSSLKYAGGLVGYVNEGVVTNSYSTGSADGESHVGGFIGKDSKGIITNSYSTGSADGESYVGGLAGYTYLGEITNCFSTGDVTGDTQVGGFIGFNDRGSITNCYWHNTLSNPDIGVGEGEGDVTPIAGDITYFYNTTNAPISSWSFPPWSRVNHTIDFPILAWQEGGEAVRYGDVDGDGNITAQDALLVRRHVANITPLEGDALIAADVDGSEGVTANDALLILQYAAGIILKFPVEEVA